MADGRGGFELVERRSACGWPSRPCGCRLLLGCSAAALALVAAACASGSAREQGPGFWGAPAALFGLGGAQLQPDAHCDEILGREVYGRLMQRSGAFERFASQRRLQSFGGQADADAASQNRLRAARGAGGSSGGILDFTLGGKHPRANGVLSWQGARGGAQEIGAMAQFKDSFRAAAARAQQTRTLTREEEAVSADAARMFDQCLQLSNNNVIAGAERSMDGEVLDLTFKYVLGNGRDAPEMRPHLQHVYWLPRQHAVCKAPFVEGGELPNAGAATTMEPGRIYAFHCHRLGEYAGTVDVSVVTDVGLFQAVMPSVTRQPGAARDDEVPHPEQEAGQRDGASQVPKAPNVAGAALHTHHAALAGAADEHALASLLDAGACSICKSCGGAWPYTLLVQEQADEVNAGLPGAACGPQASWQGSWAFCCLGAPPAHGGQANSSAV